MGRFIAIVIVLVVVALLVHRFFDVPEPEIDPGIEVPDLVIEDDVTESADAPTAAAPAEPTTTAPPFQAPPAESAPAEVDAAKPAAQVSAESEEVLLGSSELTAGIPGEGVLTAEQIDAWLADSKNLKLLRPVLPLGLAAGAGQITGVDENALTRAKIELGRQLFFDPRLSSDNTISCASCHDPGFGFTKDTQVGVGVGGQRGPRNSPVAYNRILSGPQFWDGRVASLEAQAKGPIANPIEMGNTHENAVKTVAGIEGYQKQFDVIFDDGVTIDNIVAAIASFERAIVTSPAPWDYHQQLASFEKAYADDIADLDELKEEDEELYNEYMTLKAASDAHPISDSAIRGGELFFSDKAGCTACHVGANFADEEYHNLGVGMMAAEPDLGRFKVTGEEKDRGAFKTPTVRNVALSAPYMHDGSQATLMEVVEWYAKGGHANAHLSEKIKKLDLTDQDKQDLVAFMTEGLAGEFPPIEQGRLPQ